MMTPLPQVKFAVVREDAALEATLIARFGVTRALLVASGGCTALSLRRRFPGLALSVFDINPAQLDLMQRKAAALSAGALARLNVDDPDPQGLNQRGAFEGLFRVLREALLSFVCDAPSVALYFDPLTAPRDRARLVEGWLASPYWLPCFHCAFHEPLLHAMFSAAATQHAAPGSYPGYFAQALARGLRDPRGPHNPFLQHILLGCYLAADAPDYLRGGASALDAIDAHCGTLDQVPGLDTFGLVQLSNLLDWSDDDDAARLAQTLRALRPGALILLRQLNNTRSLRAHFDDAFDFDDALGAELLALDRSLFYNRVEVGVRR